MSCPWYATHKSLTGKWRFEWVSQWMNKHFSLHLSKWILSLIKVNKLTYGIYCSFLEMWCLCVRNWQLVRIYTDVTISWDSYRACRSPANPVNASSRLGIDCTNGRKSPGEMISYTVLIAAHNSPIFVGSGSCVCTELPYVQWSWWSHNLLKINRIVDRLTLRSLGSMTRSVILFE